MQTVLRVLRRNIEGNRDIDLEIIRDTMKAFFQ